MHKVIELPTVEELHSHLPLSVESKQRVEQHRQEIRNIVSGKDPRKIMIVGPCSAWPEKAVLDYADRIKPLADEVRDQILLVMRVYIQKPRTTLGWNGPLIQPNPHSEPNAAEGLVYCREMMLGVVERGLPIADEELFTHLDPKLLGDLVSYVAIGARSVEDTEKRAWASDVSAHTGSPVVVGAKNATTGDIDVGINAVKAARSTMNKIWNRQHIITEGNPYAHLILRGGKSGPNYSKEHLEAAIAKMEAMDIEHPAIIVDTSHDNSIDPETGEKDPLKQPEIIEATADQYLNNPHFKGWMMESFIKTGKQAIPESAAELVDGMSITDACISIEDTQTIIRDIYKQLKESENDRSIRAAG